MNGSQTCPRCSHENPAGVARCRACDTALAPHALASSAGTAVPVGEGEWRQLTVVFSDLVDSTGLTQRLDAEDLGDVIRAYQDTVVAATRRFDGTVAQYLGDGVLVYFGYPHALEDAAQRAVRAALATLEGMAGLNARLERTYGLRLAVRVGIHTGRAVMTELIGDGRRELAPVGETMHLAARLSDTAAVDSVLVSDDTQRLISGFFESVPLGPMRLRGIERTVVVHRVLGPGKARSRFEAAAARGLTPFIGRAAELEALEACWSEAAAGAGRLVAVSGEAGIGKSRLLYELGQRLALGPERWLVAACAPHCRYSVFEPMLELVRQVLDAGKSPAAASAGRGARLEEMLAAVGGDAIGAGQHIAQLLDLPLDAPVDGPELAQEAERRRLIDALAGLLLGPMRDRAGVLVVEDLHWADPSSVELLDAIARRLDEVPLLVLLSARPELEHTWPRPPDRTIALDRLTPSQVRVFVDAISGGEQLPGDVVHELVTATDGIPLFVEEFARTTLEARAAGTPRDARDPAAARMPSTLRDLLMARLDGLGATKDVAQVAAVLGREFDLELLAAVVDMDTDALAPHLARLAAADLVFPEGAERHGRYVFKHALVRDAAYAALLRRRRRTLHERVARTLVPLDGEATTAPPEIVAYHLTEAGALEDAVVWWKRAARRAVQSFAGEEALRHLERAIELVAALAASPAKLQSEADLRVELCGVVYMTKGTGAEEVGAAIEAARAACERAGRDSDLHYVLYMLAGFHNLRAEYEAGQRIARDALLLADVPRAWSGAFPPAMARAGHLGTLGASLWFSGEFAASLEAARGAMDTDPAEPGFVLEVGMAHPVVVAYSNAAMALWFLGFPDQALATVTRAVTLLDGNDAAHSWSLCFARGFACEVRLHRRDADAALAEADALIALAQERGMQYWLDTGRLLRAAALVIGQRGEPLTELEEALGRAQGSETRIGTSRWLGTFAAAHALVGRIDEALGWVRAGLGFAEERGEHAWQAELFRMEGLLLLDASTPDRAAAEARLRKALAVAQAQASPAWELRAATSLAMLLRQGPHRSEVYGLLADAYARFSEGFDTPDLVEARTLLEELDG